MVQIIPLVVGTLAFLVGQVHAGEGAVIYHANTFAVDGCTTLLAKAALLVSAKDDGSGYCNVKNQQALGSMAHCIEMMPHKSARTDFLNSCAKLNSPITEEQYLASFNNATDHLVKNVTADPSFNITKPYYKPVALPKKKVEGAWDSEVGRFYNYNRANWFGIVLISYWFLVSFVAGICNLSYFLFPSLVKSFTGGVVNSYRRFISIAPLFRKSRAHHRTLFGVFPVMFPTRLESILVFGWVVLAVVFSAVDYTHDSPNLFWPKSESAEIGRKIADRTGVMSLYLMPALILFAGRNNFMQFVSGWPHSRFIYFHKWISRGVFLLVMVHAVGMTYNGKGIGNGKYEARNAQEYVRWGYVALVAASIMCFQSLMVFRRTNYELFLGGHIILAVLFVVGGWRHCEEKDYGQYFYAATAVWCFDRFIRILRLTVFGVRTANVQLIANETLRVTVKRPAYWKPYPGCVAYIHFLRPSCFWQSHPFTIVDSVEEEHTITFYMKVKGGMTHGLYQYLSKQPESSSYIKVAVEGPYGPPSAMSKFENQIYLAGGNGIPGLFYEVLDTVKRKGSAGVRLVWVIRHYRSLEWFYTELFKLKQYDVDIEIYVTQPHLGLTEPFIPSTLANIAESSDEDLDRDEETEKKSDAPEESTDFVQTIRNKLSHIKFVEGRPNVPELVRNEIANANGPIAFATCAHAAMVDDTRKAVANNLGATKYRVELFEQVQTW